MKLNEFMFLSSQRVRSSVEPAGRTETLASTRSDPFSISASEIPSSTIVWRRSWRKRFASSAERRSGRVTISTSGVPPRLWSTSEYSARTLRPPAPPTWTLFAASSSRCARTIPTSRSPTRSPRWKYVSASFFRWRWIPRPVAGSLLGRGELLGLGQGLLDGAVYLDHRQALRERERVHADHPELALARLERELEVADQDGAGAVEDARLGAEDPARRDDELGSSVLDPLHAAAPA